MLLALLIGFAFGFFGSIPVAGPVAALVLKHGMTGRAKSGAWVGLGCAAAEALYAFVAVWGFATYLAEYPWIEPTSRAVAALILGALAVVFLRYRSPKASEDRAPVESPLKSLSVGFSVTLLNPTLIATWTGATTTLYSTGLVELSARSAPWFAAGAFAGISGWFAGLSYLLHRVSGNFRTATIDRAVRGVGVVLLLLAAWFAWRFIDWLR